MSFIDKTVTVFIVMCVLGEVWCGIELGDVCGCDCVSSLDVFVIGSEIFVISPEPENSMYLFFVA